jgi:hypothetical protein
MEKLKNKFSEVNEFEAMFDKKMDSHIFNNYLKKVLC